MLFACKLLLDLTMLQSKSESFKQHKLFFHILKIWLICTLKHACFKNRELWNCKNLHYFSVQRLLQDTDNKKEMHEVTIVIYQI